MKIESISIKADAGGRRCHVRTDGKDFSFTFTDLVEFDRYIAEILMVTEGLVAPNAITNAQQDMLQIESIYVQDAGEFNKGCIPGREIEGRRADGEFVCGGAWYAEISMNGCATDCSFSSVEELYQITQTIIRREISKGGAILRATDLPKEPAHVG